MHFVRHCLALVASLLIAVPAVADEAADLSAFEAAMASGDRTAAIKAYGRIHLAKLPRDGKPVSDPTMDGLAGRVHLMIGEPEMARVWLRKPATGDRSNQTERMIAAIEAELLTGNYAEAVALAQRVAPSLPVEARPRMLVLAAQAQAMIDPAAARRLMAGLASQRPETAWRIAFVDALTAQLAGDAATARAAADRAQLLANAVPVPFHAPRHTLKLQAALAAAAGQRDRLLTLLGALYEERANNGKIAIDIADWLPVCGEEGVGPDDQLIIGLITYSSVDLAVPVPLAASRPTIVAPFMRALAGFTVTGDRSNLLPVFGPGTVMALRCTQSERRRFLPPLNPAAGGEALARLNIWPRLLEWETAKEDEPLTAAAIELDRIEAVIGKTSALLIGPLASVKQLSIAASRDRPAVRAISDRLAALYAQIGLADRVSVGGEYYMSEREYQADLMAGVEAKHADMAYAMLLDLVIRGGVDLARRAAMIDVMLARLPSNPRDRRRETLHWLKLQNVRSAGNLAGLDTLVRAQKIDPELCHARAGPPQVIQSGITDDDFPNDAISGEVTGYTIMAFDVDASGNISRIRSLVESPVAVFQPAFVAAGPRFTFQPARTAKDEAIACTGLRQGIRWALP